MYEYVTVLQYCTVLGRLVKVYSYGTVNSSTSTSTRYQVLYVEKRHLIESGKFCTPQVYDFLNAIE